MLKRDVEEAGVEEAAGDEPVPLAFGDARPEEREVRHDASGAFAEARPIPRDLGQEDEDVDRDQDVGGGCRVELAGVAGVPHHRVRWLAHSGQRIPTGVGVMQSGQIGRPQEEQETRVSRSGWR